MRLIATYKSQAKAERLSAFLESKGIDVELDGRISRDWGSDDYGTEEYFVFVIDEDKLDHALKLVEAFDETKEEDLPPPPPKARKAPPRERQRQALPSRGKITSFLLGFCCLLFVFSALTTPEIKDNKQLEGISPALISPLKKDLLYDYPKAYQLLSELVERFNLKEFSKDSPLPKAADALIEKINQTPFWQGLYSNVLAYLKHGTFLPEAPLFEKIREGEVWRIITPIFLHGDIFHLLFNMLWLYVLGMQLEARLKPSRYLLFILIAAAFSNTAQYLMSGPNFIGFSGVLCAFLTFIWMRQKAAPWEGYQLQHSTFIFMMLFIFGMFALQLLSFSLEVITGTDISTPLANTAHLSGALIGVILAKIAAFTEERKNHS